MFGLRFDLRHPDLSPVTASERYRACVDMCEWADARGAVFIGLSEHHGSEDGYLPSPLTLAAAVAARTSSAVINVAALIAPFHDPLRLAEDAAVVDLISGGRLALIVAGGYVPSEFEMFGVPMSERAQRVTEAMTTLRAAWTGQPFEHRGRTVTVRPTPTSEGGPMLLMGGTSEGAARRAARLADGFVPSDLACWEHYRDECLALGRPDPGPSRAAAGGEVVVLAEDPEAAWEELGPYFLHETNAYGRWQQESGLPTPFAVASDVDELRAGDQYRILTPDEHRAEVEAAGDEAFVVLHPMVGGIPPDLAWRHLHLFEQTFLT
ncbi:LLM class flavin-dependent oxidoreductase [Dermatobacter hominis]|uniref:LLM class flavin-dependent oxidoreductase n=1 Tax=Dermatobacter hominis TaxID=2884263 RepID=UPI001D10C617|nr:LLM class flavin-dependent oxidoreductase [Dermatobacter hominis]UDY38027.1 LLM class flavin-dependent oxidoreductase [Dermatobacter hominis]